MITFGSGILTGVDTNGNSIDFGTLQTISFGLDWDLKELYGQYQFARAVGRAKAKLQLKAAYGEFRASAFNLVIGGTVTLNARRKVVRETLAVTAGAATATATAGTITKDLGVFDLTNPAAAVALTVTSGTVAAGQYKIVIATGAYTVMSTLTSISVTYEKSLTTGMTIAMTNAMMGTAPTFAAYLGNESNGVGIEIALNKCMASKLDLSFKNEDFLVPNFEFEAMVDATGSPGIIYLDE